MNKLLTIIGIGFFILEAIVVSIFLLDVSAELLEKAVPWIIGGGVNIAFLFVLLFGVFKKR